MQSSRRIFLQQSATLVAGALTSPSLGHASPADRINVALIGCNGMGFYNLQDHLKLPNISCVALCDVDDAVLNRRSAEVLKITGKSPRLIKDFRRVIDDKSVDVV